MGDTLGVVIDISVEGLGAWLGILVAITVLVAAAWRVGKIVHDCFDDIRQENKKQRELLESLATQVQHEAEMQKYRHTANLAAIGEQREKIAVVDADLTKARLDIAQNTAMIRAMGHP